VCRAKVLEITIQSTDSAQTSSEKPFEGILSGLGKGVDTALDESLDPVVEAENNVIDAVVDILAIPACSLASGEVGRRGLLDLNPTVRAFWHTS
jgi:hypothetical protein